MSAASPMEHGRVIDIGERSEQFDGQAATVRTAETASLDDVLHVLKEIADRIKPASTLIDRSEFASMVSIGISTFDKLKAAGSIAPAAVWIGGSLRWNRDEVRAWLSTPTHKNELHDSRSWPGVWKQLKTRS